MSLEKLQSVLKVVDPELRYLIAIEIYTIFDFICILISLNL